MHTCTRGSLCLSAAMFTTRPSRSLLTPSGSAAACCYNSNSNSNSNNHNNNGNSNGNSNNQLFTLLDLCCSCRPALQPPPGRGYI